jgi:putative FmdB family regulatory protein
MPIYEFHCESCGNDSEILVRSARWKGTKCPRCSSTKLTKTLSTFASRSAGPPASAPPCEGGSGACGCRCAGPGHRH